MISGLLHHQPKMPPVNAWPWRGWQVYGGGRGLRGGMISYVS